LTGVRPAHRRALALLAGSRDGCTEATVLALGFTVEQLVELVTAGLATATPERMVAGGRTVEVVRLKIADAGREARTSCHRKKRGIDGPWQHLRQRYQARSTK
jgi:hypothetical protein